MCIDVRHIDQTTVYTWPPTADETGRAQIIDDTFASFRLDKASKSELRRSTQSWYNEMEETQDTQSYDYSDTSSIAHFPSFQFSLHSLTSLSSLRNSSGKGSRTVAVLLAVLEVEGPNTIKIKNGRDAGKEVSMLSLILGDENGVCKLTAWREVADAWSGEGDSPGVKRGDIIYIESTSSRLITNDHHAMSWLL